MRAEQIDVPVLALSHLRSLRIGIKIENSHLMDSQQMLDFETDGEAMFQYLIGGKGSHVLAHLYRDDLFALLAGKLSVRLDS